jgi:crotonobetainyl-CoA:carnitine CoA-transferase CaiB-like acyl-CoA transferase
MSAPADDTAGLPLDGVRVLDLAGPLGSYCGRLLADIGADVVKAEPPTGDELRHQPPFAGDRRDPEGSLSFAYYQANKRGIVLNCARADDLPALAELGGLADVILITPGPRSPVAGLDADRRELSWAGPEAVVCSITPFGLTGPYRTWRATHFTSYALSGLMYAHGPAAGPPRVIPGRQAWDHVGTHAAIAVLAALRARPAAGGQFIDLSAHEVLAHSSFDLHRYTSSLVLSPRAGVRKPGVQGGMYECRDGLIEFTVSTDKHWTGLVELLGSPAELNDPALSHPVTREQRAGEILPLLESLIGDMSREDFITRGQQLGVPCALVNTVGQFTADPQPRSRGFFTKSPLAGLGIRELPGRPFLSTQPLLAQYRRPAPRLGEHAADVLNDWRSGGRAVPGGPPLTGIRAISFGTAIAGALSGTALAELGADVIKIESPSRPDNLRRLRFPGDPATREPSGADTSPMFANFNRTTRSLALDMKQPASVELFLRLVREADVVIENYGPGVMKRWGVSYDTIAAANPRIVMLSLTGFGHTEGPRSHYLAYGSTICSFTGLTRAWGESDGTHFDFVSQAHGLFGILAALAARDRTGLGTHIDLAEIEAAAAVMGPLLLDYLVNGREPADPAALDGEPDVGGQGTVGGKGAPFRQVVRCRGEDRWLAVEVENAADWRTLAHLLGRPDLGAAEAPGEYPRTGLIAALAEWAARRTPHQAMRALQRAGLAAGAVQDTEDVVRDPQHRSRGFLIEMDHPDLGVAEFAAPPYRLSATPAVPRRRTPRLGEHTAEILADWLGMSPEEARPYRWPPRSGFRGVPSG